MKILIHLKSGAFRSLKTWKGILVIWALYLILISILVLPLRAGMNSMLGNSMITELLYDGINIDVLTDLGPGLRAILASFSAGFSFVIFITFIMNAFITGGVFAMLKSEENPTARMFFEGGASNFWSFIIITMICTIIIIGTAILLFFIPLAIMSDAESPQDGFVLKTIRLLALVVIFLIPVIVLVADNARAWQVTRGTRGGFRALGKGFRLTFRNFFSSYLMMIFLLAIQVFYTWAVFRILSGTSPVTGGGIFLLFIFSQVLFVIRLFMKVWRFGSIISLVLSGIKKKVPAQVQTFDI